MVTNQNQYPVISQTKLTKFQFWGGGDSESVFVKVTVEPLQARQVVINMVLTSTCDKKYASARISQSRQCLGFRCVPIPTNHVAERWAVTT